VEAVTSYVPKVTSILDTGLATKLTYQSGVGWRAAVSGEYVDAVLALKVGDEIGAVESGLGAYGVEQDELLSGAAGEFATMPLEFFDEFGVEFASVGHG
jgi:hypothetical protein